MTHWSERFRAIVSVYLILLNDQGDVLLLRRSNTGYKDGELGLPAGHVDGEEELMQAMQREAQEEVGIDLDPADLSLAHVMHRYCGDHERLDFFFTARKWSGEPSNCERDKCSELIWAPMDQLPEDVIDYYRQAFEKIREGEVYSAFDWADKIR
ncbi:NUDIX hydrolase [Candidatus Uhrbacteria bacterium CG_4_9_14_3_um_filter_50_9]|uniref:NUDIX hydrolase n=1 Tax=Candidatus Uhrbacteria bacterium CG_4_9_14_3_um_filter_50_9 TaxID=1975035 RepID=A0A2M7XC73_9BACT|nr:MAG: NUDIX hydrolase [Candidatus Uhrbacteria bacterium CG_4_9_14_3_um_filter_50_9]